MCACGKPSVRRSWCGVELCAECFARHCDSTDVEKRCAVCCSIAASKPVDVKRRPDGQFAIKDKPAN